MEIQIYISPDDDGQAVMRMVELVVNHVRAGFDRGEAPYIDVVFSLQGQFTPVEASNMAHLLGVLKFSFACRAFGKAGRLWIEARHRLSKIPF
jgi:hypothetical protein